MTHHIQFTGSNRVQIITGYYRYAKADCHITGMHMTCSVNSLTAFAVTGNLHSTLGYASLIMSVIENYRYAHSVVTKYSIPGANPGGLD